jgi:hypothetical protein
MDTPVVNEELFVRSSAFDLQEETWAVEKSIVGKPQM